MKRKISPELLDRIKHAVSIVDVVGEHVVLRKSGSNYSGLCPFHNERSPSFSVSENKGLYHCYGCKKGGDLISFIMELHGLSFVEAIEDLADRAQVALPKDFSDEDGADPEVAKRRAAAREKTQTLYKLNRFAAKFFRDQVAAPPQKHIAQYFKQRGMTDELAKSFYLGAAPASWDALSRFLENGKAPMPLAVELGLVKPSTKTQKAAPGEPPRAGYFDLFRNRAMFPILDLRGKVVGFGGRGLPLPKGAPEVGDGTPKYLNSSESSIFHKGKIAYGLFQAQKHIREKDEVVLVEGYFDVLGLHAAGFQNAVATCGTALTPDHLQLFRKFCSKITLLFDGDRAGIQAMDRSMEIGLQNGMILHGCMMPEGLDPDEMIFDGDTGKMKLDGREKMQFLLAGSKPMLDARIEAAFQHSLKGAEAKTKALKQVASWLAMYTDPVGREVRIETVLQQFQVSRSLLEQAMVAGGGRAPKNTPFVPANGVKIGGNPEKKEAPRREPPREKLTPREAVLVTGLLKSGPFLSIFREAVQFLPPGLSGQELGNHRDVRKLIDWVLTGNAPSAAVFDLLEDPKVRALASEALVAESAAAAAGSNRAEEALTESEFKLACQRSIALSWARFSQELKQRLRDAELKKDAGLHASLSQEYLDVQRRLKEFGTFYDES